jgi:hypothetical protein
MAIGLERSICQHEYSRITQIMSTDDLSRVWVSIWPGAQSSGPRFAPCVCVERMDLRALCLCLQVCSCEGVCVPRCLSQGESHGVWTVATHNRTNCHVYRPWRVSASAVCAGLKMVVMLLPYEESRTTRRARSRRATFGTNPDGRWLRL